MEKWLSKFQNPQYLGNGAKENESGYWLLIIKLHMICPLVYDLEWPLSKTQSYVCQSLFIYCIFVFSVRKRSIMDYLHIM